MQIQCPWCHRLGLRLDERDYIDHGGHYRHRDTGELAPGPHADGSPCACRHINCHDRREAQRARGRYYDSALNRWVCLGGCDGGEVVTP